MTVLVRTLSFLALAIASSHPGAQTPADTQARHRLQQRQLEDRLKLDTQQGLAPRGSLSPADRRRLDELQTRQRAEQQRLAVEQELILRQRANAPDDRSLDVRQRLLDQDRELQLQRFQLEQHELLRSMRPPPLQRPPVDGALQ